jgi:hypothetical protein
LGFEEISKRAGRMKPEVIFRPTTSSSAYLLMKFYKVEYKENTLQLPSGTSLSQPPASVP